MYRDKPGLHTREKAHRPGSLRTVSVDVTTRCNMACPHCYAASVAAKPMMAVAEMSSGIQEARALGAYHWILQGGEPICDGERLEQLVRAIGPSDSYLVLVTNGWAMDRQTIAWLKDLGIDKIAFSLDSGVESEHDRNRMPGSFLRTTAAIKDVTESGLLSSVSVVVTDQNLRTPTFDTALALAREHGIRIDVQIAMPVGNWEANHEALITPDDAAYIRGLRDRMGRLPNGQMMINRDVYNFGGRDHCPAGAEFMAITAAGDIMPCNFMQVSLGNIGRDSFSACREDLIKDSRFNGASPVCLLGEDRGFLAQFVTPNIGKEKPLHASAIGL